MKIILTLNTKVKVDLMAACLVLDAARVDGRVCDLRAGDADLSALRQDSDVGVCLCIQLFVIS